MKYDNALRARIRAGTFATVVEFVTPEAADELEHAIAPIVELGERIKGDARVHAIAITDRVKSDHDHDPVRVGARVAEASGKTPTVHLSGKDRDPRSLADALARMREADLENMLLITGDKVKVEPTDRRVRYHDSVDMIAQARAASPGALMAAAVSPFKYREEDLLNQYLKMAKKERAGADLFITQVGWDMLKLKELAAYRRRRGFPAPVMVGMMLLTVARARFIRANKLAGITITDELQAMMEAEATLPDKGLARAYHRLALQIVGVERLGFAGFQLTGMHQFDKLDRLLGDVERLRRELPTEADWWAAWWEALRGPDGRPAAAAPAPLYLFRELAEPWGWNVALDALTAIDVRPSPAPTAESRKRDRLDLLDRVLFRDGAPGAAVLGPLARLVPRRSALEGALHRLERTVKEPIVGCDTCGFCRLPFTAYVCPETCPKGLANGPCGGTELNRCEFGDRECIHNRKYRIERDAGRLDDLESLFIPPVEAGQRHTCSWTNHFRGEDPPVVRLPDLLKSRGSGKSRRSG